MYSQAIEELEEAIQAKQKLILKETLIEGSIREDEKDTRLYIGQMNFNKSVCYLMLGDFHNALFNAEKLSFYSNDPFY